MALHILWKGTLMKPYNQQKFGEFNDSLRACVISLLNSNKYNIEDYFDVPNFIESVDWQKELVRWCKLHHLYTFTITKYVSDYDGISIATGKSPRGNSVLWQKNVMIWDPHKDRMGLLLKPTNHILLIPFNYTF